MTSKCIMQQPAMILNESLKNCTLIRLKYDQYIVTYVNMFSTVIYFVNLIRDRLSQSCRSAREFKYKYNLMDIVYYLSLNNYCLDYRVSCKNIIIVFQCILSLNRKSTMVSRTNYPCTSVIIVLVITIQIMFFGKLTLYESQFL